MLKITKCCSWINAVPSEQLEVLRIDRPLRFQGSIIEKNVIWKILQKPAKGNKNRKNMSFCKISKADMVSQKQKNNQMDRKIKENIQQKNENERFYL